MPMSVTEPSHSLVNGDHAHAAFQGFDWSRRISERGLAFSVAEGGASGHPYARLPGCPPARPQPLTRLQQLYVVLATGGAVWHFRCNQESSQTCWRIRCLLLLLLLSRLWLFVVVCCCCCCRRHVSVSLLLLLLMLFVVVVVTSPSLCCCCCCCCCLLLLSSSRLCLFVVVVVVVAAAVCCCYVSVSLLLLLLLLYVTSLSLCCCCCCLLLLLFVVTSLSLFPSLSFPPYSLSLKSQIHNKQKIALPQFQGA